MSRAVKIIVGVLVVVLLGAGSFYGGSLYGKSQASTSLFAVGEPIGAGEQFNGQPGASGQPFQPGAGRGGGAAVGTRVAGAGGMTLGEVESVDGSVLIIKDANGKQVRVQVTDTTLIEKNASVAITDLAQGETVTVSGSTNADGSITARSVAVISAGRFGGVPMGTPAAGQ